MYSEAIDVAVLGSMYDLQGAAALPPAYIGVGDAVGPFMDCSESHIVAGGVMTNRYLGGSDSYAFARNQVLDRVGSNNGVVSEDFFQGSPAAAAGAGVTFLPKAGYIPALYNGTVSFGQMAFPAWMAGASARVLAAWDGAFGTLTIQYAGYTVAVSETTVTIRNPLIATVANASYTYAANATYTYPNAMSKRNEHGVPERHVYVPGDGQPRLRQPVPDVRRRRVARSAVPRRRCWPSRRRWLSRQSARRSTSTPRSRSRSPSRCTTSSFTFVRFRRSASSTSPWGSPAERNRNHSEMDMLSNKRG